MFTNIKVELLEIFRKSKNEKVKFRRSHIYFYFFAFHFCLTAYFFKVLRVHHMVLPKIKMFFPKKKLKINVK